MRASSKNSRNGINARKLKYSERRKKHQALIRLIFTKHLNLMQFDKQNKKDSSVLQKIEREKYF